jgi:sulfite exporter TauE/SafE/copper chaperone CopZ
MEQYKFQVNGMHCKACITLTESELCTLPGVQKVTASLSDTSVTVEGEFGEHTKEQIASQFTKVLQPHGYTVSAEKNTFSPAWSDFKIAAPIAAILIILFIGLQKLGVANLITASRLDYRSIFIIGLVASVSSCMAVVGGLVLSVSANFAKQGDRLKPQLFFHLSRLISFFILGGIIGTLGATVQLGIIGNFILNLLVGLVLGILGINLLDIFPWAKKIQPAMPSFIGKQIYALKNLNHTLTPALLGAATFFLPCGFTQSMQIYALSTKQFMPGAITMFIFALGTLPALAILGASSANIGNKFNTSAFFKTAGLVVLFFALLNIAGSLAAIGLIPPLFNF